MTALEDAKYLARTNPRMWAAVLQSRERVNPSKFVLNAMKPGKPGGLAPKKQP